jgi:hypothetical protein
MLRVPWIGPWQKQTDRVGKVPTTATGLGVQAERAPGINVRCRRDFPMRIASRHQPSETDSGEPPGNGQNSEADRTGNQRFGDTGQQNLRRFPCIGGRALSD